MSWPATLIITQIKLQNITSSVNISAWITSDRFSLAMVVVERWKKAPMIPCCVRLLFWSRDTKRQKWRTACLNRGKITGTTSTKNDFVKLTRVDIICYSHPCIQGSGEHPQEEAYVRITKSGEVIRGRQPWRGDSSDSGDRRLTGKSSSHRHSTFD